jgi:uncharacterized protein (DUF4415 family)
LTIVHNHVNNSAVEFEWDESKRETNIARHGVDFIDSARVFEGAVLETEDKRRDYGERRYRAPRAVQRSRAARDLHLAAGSPAALLAPEGQIFMSERHITRVSADKLKQIRSRTDWKRVDALTEAEITQAAADDPDAPLTSSADWTDARVILPQAKEPVTLRLDKDVLVWFRSHGRGYQTRINAVLRAFVEAQKHHGRGRLKSRVASRE